MRQPRRERRPDGRPPARPEGPADALPGPLETARGAAELSSRRLAAALAILGVAAGLACGSETPAPRGEFQRVVLVTIDTLRADHLGAYGYPRETSPFFDRLARDGVLFERAYAASATTTPSHASLFTSRYPAEHGVLRNGLVLRDDFVTLAERFAAAGFQTAGFVAAGALFHQAGLGQGFEHFDAPERGASLPYRSADATVDAALAWLEAEARPDRPLFLFVHLFDPHGPLVPPERQRRRFALKGAERRSFVGYLLRRRGIRPGTFGAGIDGMLEQYQNYDAEILFADTELSRLFEALVRPGDPRPWLWVVTADHGQGMGSHLFFGHGKNIYEEQVRVPLVVYATDRAFPAHRVEAVVEHVDLLPTLTELTGLGPAREPVRGRSLVPLLRGGDETPFRGHSALAQRRAYEEPDPMRSPGIDYELGEKFALVGPRWKYIHRSIGGDELYDLRRDPLEMRNRVDDRPERAAALRERLQLRLAELRRQASPPAADVDRETGRQLEELGYLP